MPQINLDDFPALFQVYDTHETLIVGASGTGVPALGVWALPAGAPLLVVALSQIRLRGRM